jgi:MFS family permease
MSFIDLVQREPRSIAFGFMYTFGSSAGQTFFISIFVPSMAASFAIEAEQFGYLYGAATIVSAVCLPFVGRLVDRLDLLHFGIATGLLLALACIAMAASIGPVTLFASLAALRLFGQGLMTHTAMTATSRYFVADRGKALSLTGLGHAAGEALLPLAAVTLIAMIGWRFSFALSGLVLGVLVSITAAYQVRQMMRFRRPGNEAGPRMRSAAAGVPIWRLPAFWALMPIMIAAPFTLTALIFHQGLIAAGSGLPLTVFAASFVVFALMQVPGSILGGRWIDQVSARMLLPWHLLPAMAGIALLALAGTAWSVVGYLALSGFANGSGAILRSAVIAEMVPTASIGAARSIASSAMVLSTAAGPAVFGLLYGLGLSTQALLWTAFGVFGIASMLAAMANQLFPTQEKSWAR